MLLQPHHIRLSAYPAYPISRLEFEAASGGWLKHICHARGRNYSGACYYSSQGFSNLPCGLKWQKIDITNFGFNVIDMIMISVLSHATHVIENSTIWHLHKLRTCGTHSTNWIPIIAETTSCTCFKEVHYKCKFTFHRPLMLYLNQECVLRRCEGDGCSRGGQTSFQSPCWCWS